MFLQVLMKINFISPIFYQVLYMTVIGSIVGLIIYFIRNIFDKKISGKWKCIMWCIALITLWVPIRFEVQTNKTSVVQNEIIDKVEAIKHIPNYEYTQVQKNQEVAQSNNENIEQVIDVNTISFKDLFINLIMPCIWLFGSIIFVLTFFVGTRKINKRIVKNIYTDERIENILKECKEQLHIKKKVKIILQKYKRVPSIFGIVNPSILVTQQTLEDDDETIKYIFLHELAHYKRKDILFNFILLCTLSLHWFNPVVWFLFKKIRQDIEIGADELASKDLNQTQKKEYGMVLINLLRRKEENYTASMLCMSDGGKNMERRIRMIKIKSTSIIISMLLFIIILGVVAGVVFVKFVNVENFEIKQYFENINLQPVSEEEKKIVTEYLDEICTGYYNIRGIPEFKNINEADKYWIYSHLKPGTAAYINDNPYVYDFGYSTKDEIEECIRNLFGADLIVDLEKDMALTENLLDVAANVYYVEEKDVYEFAPYGWDMNTWYAIDTIQKEDELYKVKVIEYLETGDLFEKYSDIGIYSFVYTDEEIEKFRMSGGTEQAIEVFNYETSNLGRGELKKTLDNEVLKRKEQFDSYNIILGHDKNGKLCVKEIEKGK